MLSLSLYKVVHIIGIVMAMTAIAGAAMHALAGGNREPGSPRRMLAILHGVGGALVLVGGFGMLARLGVMHGGGFPAWIWVKLVIWVLIGVAMILPYRRPALARILLVAMPLLAGLAAYMGIYKPI